jgi:hypothetical protein
MGSSILHAVYRCFPCFVLRRSRSVSASSCVACVDTGLSWLCVSGSTTIHVSSGIAIAIGHLLYFTFLKRHSLGARCKRHLGRHLEGKLERSAKCGWLPCCAQLLTLRRNIGSQRTIALVPVQVPVACLKSQARISPHSAITAASSACPR